MFCCIIVTDYSPQKGSMTRKGIDCLSFVVRIIPHSATILFCTAIGLISSHLEAIRAELQSLLTRSKKLSEPDVAFASDLWVRLKRQHYLVYKVIREMNQFFGFYLLFVNAYIFTGVVNSSLFTLLSVVSKKGLMILLSLGLLVDHLLHLFFTTSYTDRIATEITDDRPLNFFLKLVPYLTDSLKISTKC